MVPYLTMARTKQKKRSSDRPIRRQQQIRMDDALKGRISAFQQSESARVGYEVSFSAAVRNLIEKGLVAS